MIELLESRFEIGPHELSISPSIGIALYPVDVSNFDELARSADAAMYRAKHGGRNTFRFFIVEIQAYSARIFTLENALRHAVERKQLSIHYQPQISAAGDYIVGAEALLQWNHPELGSVSSAEFVAVAESSGLISPIGEWVLRTACSQLKSWLDAGRQLPSLSVNLSAVQFWQEALPELVSQVFRESAVPPRRLELELTGSVAADDPMGAVAIIQRLLETGVRMSIDDFGTGHRSLSYLKRFKVNRLKIEQPFVRNVLDDPDDQAIVRFIISLESNLGLQTIAEGVETLAQKNYLCKLGCMEIQGYWLSRPLPVEQFEAFMRDRAGG